MCTTSTFFFLSFSSSSHTQNYNKMAFRDLQFNIGKLTTNVKSQVAKNNPLQNQDTRALNLWLFEERNDLSNMKTTAYHHAETNKAFLEWVKEEQNKYQSNEIYSQDIEVPKKNVDALGVSGS